jgi:basic membrane protein A
MISFEQGVRYYNESHGTGVEVVGWSTETGEGLFIGDFCCSSEGYAMAERILQEGADVIMPAAGSSSVLGAGRRVLE